MRSTNRKPDVTHTAQAMTQPTIDALLEQIAILEQKLANRELLLERILIWLRNRPLDEAGDFMAGIEKHLGILHDVEGDQEEEARTLGGGAKAVHLRDGVELRDKET